MRSDVELHPSWICRNEFERVRFMDLHGRLVRANNTILLTLIVVIVLSLPFIPDRLGLIPAGAGLLLFGGIQRNAMRFARPELWVFGAVLGAEALIALAIAVHGGGQTPAIALLCWPIAGLAGRFPDRASRLGDGLRRDPRDRRRPAGRSGCPEHATRSPSASCWSRSSPSTRCRPCCATPTSSTAAPRSSTR